MKLTSVQFAALQYVIELYDRDTGMGPNRMRVPATGPGFAELVEMGLLIDTRKLHRNDVAYSFHEAYVPTEAGRKAWKERT